MYRLFSFSQRNGLALLAGDVTAKASLIWGIHFGGCGRFTRRYIFIFLESNKTFSGIGQKLQPHTTFSFFQLPCPCP